VKGNRWNDRLDKVSDALYGASDELTTAEAADDLVAAGVDREELYRRIFDKLCLLARTYRLKEQAVPHRLGKAIEDLRKKVGEPRTKEEFERRADSTISKLLDSVRGRSLSGTPRLAFSSHFRHLMSEQTPEDQRIIEKLERELETDLNEEQEDSD